MTLLDDPQGPAQTTSHAIDIDPISLTKECSKHIHSGAAPVNFGALAPSSINPTVVPIQGTSFDGKRMYFGRRYKPRSTPSVILQHLALSGLCHAHLVLFQHYTSITHEKPLNLLETPLHRLMQEVSQAKKSSMSVR